MTRLRSTGLALLLLVTIVAVFWPAFSYPFIQDDWERLASIGRDTTGDSVAGSTAPTAVLYRPLTEQYHILMYRLFGLNSAGFHGVSVVLLWAAAVLVVFLVLRMTTGDRLVAWATGFLFATATPVLMEPMLWMAGIEPLASLILALSSMVLVLRGHQRLSLVPLSLAVLFWEMAILMPLVPVLFLLLEPRGEPPAERRARALAALWPYAVLLGLYGLFRMLWAPPVAASPDHPYALALLGSHLWKNAFLYAKWGWDAVFPFKEVINPGRVLPWLEGLSHASSWLFYGLVVAITGLLLHFRRRRDDPSLHPAALVWAVWITCGIAPVFFLVNHSYRYYLVFSLAPLSVLVLTALRRVALATGLGRRGAAMVLVAFTMAGVFSGEKYLSERDKEGLQQRFLEGTNLLIKRGATVDIVREGLARMLPAPPRGAVLLFDGIDIWSFDRASGPRVWYGDWTIEAYEAAYVRSDQDGFFVEGAPATQAETYTGAADSGRHRLDPDRTFLFALRERRLVQLPLSQLAARAEATERQAVGDRFRIEAQSAEMGGRMGDAEAAYSAAIAAYESALVADPARCRDLCRALGRLLSDRGRHDEAVKFLRRATSDDLFKAEAWANLCLAYMRGGRSSQAVDACLQAHELQPEHYYVNSMLAELYSRDHRWAEAAAAARDALAKAPDQNQRRACLILLARASAQFGATGEACGAYREALEIRDDAALQKEAVDLGCSVVGAAVAQNLKTGPFEN